MKTPSRPFNKETDLVRLQGGLWVYSTPTGRVSRRRTGQTMPVQFWEYAGDNLALVLVNPGRLDSRFVTLDLSRIHLDSELETDAA